MSNDPMRKSPWSMDVYGETSRPPELSKLPAPAHFANTWLSRRRWSRETRHVPGFPHISPRHKATKIYISAAPMVVWPRLKWWFRDGSKPWHLVNIKIAGKWMFIPLKLILIGFDPSPFNEQRCRFNQPRWWLEWLPVEGTQNFWSTRKPWLLNTFLLIRMAQKKRPLTH